MKLTLYGTRGSIPTPSRPDFSTQEFGGNTTCYVVNVRGRDYIFDAGSGISLYNPTSDDLNLFLTHTHWDHIQGLPMFKGIYKRTKIKIYGERRNLKSLLEMQQRAEFFPVKLRDLPCSISTQIVNPEQTVFQDELVRVIAERQNHPGNSLGYRIFDKKTWKSIVIATDFETESAPKFWNKADLVLADGQYEKGSKINPFREGWGHADPFQDVNFGKKRNVQRMLITHHAPIVDDEYHKDLEKRVQNYSDVQIELAREGRSYEVS